ncbi:ABC transporter permease [Aliiroseovarius sp. xm-m-339-2]|uniref:ABC transporter permease n=1 Tax=Aliiroseovarius sp. xm-m-339-2 TaxID=2651829 RepID=UPI001567D09A|nr:ABC transporter permease [Aliiroseovarius sp. xm-m-339-2]NRP42784.1 Polysialic acid transport protein KpsM [Aliiroseovarius sp. xm-m-339-2]
MLESIQIRLSVIIAVMMRDMRTRFGRSYLGYVIAILWPLMHLVGLTIIFSLLRQSSPIFGSDNAVFIATGAVPYILFIYPSRMTSFAFETNKSIFVFPVVSVLDLMVARACIEMLSACVVVFVFAVGASSIGLDIIPFDYHVAAGAIFSTIYLSISLGLLSAVIISVMRFWHTLFALISIFAYLSSGIFLPIEDLSPNIQNVLWFNPLAHCVEWLRSAYYVDYGISFISRSYVYWVSNVTLLIALLGERFIRGRLLMQ